MIEVTFKAGSDRRVIVALRSRGPRLVSEVTKAVDESMYLLLRRIQEKLSGEVLQPRAGGGGLLGTVRKVDTKNAGNKITGAVQAGGGAAKAYAMVHEYGGLKWYDIFPGIVTGKSDKKALAFFPAGSEGAGPLRGLGRSLTFKLGARKGILRPSKYSEFAGLGGIVVRHVKHPPAKERSYARSSLEELRGQIVGKIFAAAAKAVK